MKATLILLFTTVILYTVAQNCENPLLKLYGFQGLASPTSEIKIPYCNNLKNGQTCCSFETVVDFQTKVNTLRSKLERIGGIRDLYILQLEEQYFQQYLDLLNTLSNYSSNLNEIQSQNTDIGNKISEQITLFQNIASEVSSLRDNFLEAMLKYQTARVSCSIKTMKVQASAWCLACDPNYGSKGVLSDGTILFSDDLCTTISSSCYGFMIQSSVFNPYVMMRQALGRLTSINNYLKSYSDNVGIIPDYIIDNDYLKTSNTTEQTIGIPNNCENAGNCLWQCQNIFQDGILNEILVGNGGGIIGGNDLNLQSIGVASASDTTAEGDNKSLRVLQDSDVGVWTPDLEATGMIFRIDSDPAGVSDGLGWKDTDESDSDGHETPNSDRRYLNSGNIISSKPTTSVLAISIVIAAGVGYI